MSMSDDDLDYHYKQIVKKRRNHQIYAGILAVAGMAIFMSVVIIGGSIQSQTYDLVFWGSLPTLIISAIVIAILKPKSKKYKVKKHHLFFVKFYEAFESLQNLKENMEKSRTELYENNIKDAKLEVEVLADHIDEWIVSTSPYALQELPNSLSKALRKRIIPVIKSTDEMNIIKFYTLLKDKCELLYTREPTYEEWSIFNKKLNSIGALQEGKPTKRKISKPLFLLKPYVGAPLIWSTFTGILFYQKPEDYIIPLAIITGVAFTAATFLASEYVRSYVSKNQKQQLEEKMDVEIKPNDSIAQKNSQNVLKKLNENPKAKNEYETQHNLSDPKKLVSEIPPEPFLNISIPQTIYHNGDLISGKISYYGLRKGETIWIGVSDPSEQVVASKKLKIKVTKGELKLDLFEIKGWDINGVYTLEISSEFGPKSFIQFEYQK
ncbi:MAG: hypothetical protein ACT4NJ_04350 [Nitrosopumilaceae archaeon]